VELLIRKMDEHHKASRETLGEAETKLILAEGTEDIVVENEE